MKAGILENNGNNTVVGSVHPLNIYRTVSVMIVFMLHTSIFSASLGFAYDESTWFLETPAWAGVWLFLLLSGYLIGKGFLSGRYKEDGKYTVKSIFRFYISRIVKVAIPTWTFSFLSIILLEPGFFVANKGVIFQIITFRYYNNPGSSIIGATWYVSTLMWLYLLAPFFCMLVEMFLGEIKKRRNIVIGVVFLAVAILGMLLRLFLYKKGVDWSSMVYVPYYCNIDIYICGILINLFDIKGKDNGKNRVWGIAAFVLLIAALIANIRIYYLGGDYLFYYQYIFPTIYILVGGFYLMVWGGKSISPKITLKAIVRNPLRLIDGFADISFEFYLVHSMVLNSICTYTVATTPFRSHMLLMVCAFFISVLLSVLMHRAFQKRKVGD